MAVRRAPFLLLLVSLLAGPLACDDDPAPRGRDGGADAGADAPVADAQADADAVAGCEGVAEGTIGAAGGTLSLCGATLRVPADALTEDTAFAIHPAKVPGPEAPYELAGEAFTFSATPATLPGLVEVELPHGGGGRVELRRLHDGSLAYFEACRVEDTLIAQHVTSLGTFVAVVDPTPYPAGPNGLGDGTVSYTVDEEAYTGRVEVGGYVIDEAVGASKSVTAALRVAKGDSFVQLQLKFHVDAEGSVTILEVTWYDLADGLSGVWSIGAHSNDELTVDLIAGAGGSIAGTLEATLHDGDTLRALSASLTVTPVRWRFPPELACYFIDG